MTAHAWIKSFPGAVTVCDTEGIILEMNDQSIRTFAAEGGKRLIGTNLLDCHPEPSRSRLQEMMRTQSANVYTIDKLGVKKLIYQTPWYQNGEYAGFVELSLVIPANMPHFFRFPKRTPEEREAIMQRLPRQTVRLEPFEAEGWVLDVGGGGEGVIGQLLGPQVVAIDPVERELADTPPGPLKIVMDARKLNFLDGTFGAAACFFALMFMRPVDQPLVLAEIYRVLRPGARLYVWDLNVPAEVTPGKELLVMPLTVELPGLSIETGYGTLWVGREQSLAGFERMAASAGFALESTAQEGLVIRLVLRKPA